MNKVCNLLFATLRGALNGCVVEAQMVKDLSTIEWAEFVRLAQQHNAIPLVCDGLAGLRREMPANVFTKIAGLTIVAEDKYAERKEVIKELSNLFALHNVPFMVIKGYGISLYYPTPEHRTFSDVDTYNFGQLDRADELLKNELGVNVDVDVHHHTTCVYKGVLIENHYDFINTSQHGSNMRYEQILKSEVEKRSVEHSLEDEHILLPSARFNALFLMRHMAAHYAAERVSLRHLCDWKQFVEHEGSNIDWESIRRIYKEYNMHRFADAITSICIDYLAMDATIIPDIVRNNKLETRILNDILYAEFNEEKPQKGFVSIVWWKIRRYFANSWKHKLIYNESWIKTFFQSTYAHLLKPKTIRH